MDVVATRLQSRTRFRARSGALVLLCALLASLLTTTAAHAAEAPTAPTRVAAFQAVAAGTVAVYWEESATAGDSAIESYTAEASAGGQSCELLAADVPADDEPSCVISGLTEGTSYTFTVFASNAGADSADSAASEPLWIVEFVPPTVALSDVYLFSAYDGYIGVHWAEATAPVGVLPWRIIATASPGGATCTTYLPGFGNTCSIGGLVNGATYSVTVRMENAAGGGPATELQHKLLWLPDAPTDVAVAPTTRGAIVSWQPPADDGASPILGYRVTTWPAEATCTTTGATSCVLPLRTPGTYNVSVRAYNAVGANEPSGYPDATITLAPPSAPIDVAATINEALVATISWAPPLSTGGFPLTHYVVSASPAVPLFGCNKPVTTSCTATGLAAGVAYSFSVIAYNTYGPSQKSPASAAVVAPAATATTPEPSIAPPATPVPVAPPAAPPLVAPAPVAPPSARPIYSPPAAPLDTEPPLPVGVVSVAGQLAADGTAGARLAWSLLSANDVAAVRIGVTEGTLTPTAGQTAAGVVVSSSATGATISGLRAGVAYTIGLYAADAVGNLSRVRTVQLAGTRARTTAPAAVSHGAVVPVRLLLTDLAGKGLARQPVDVMVRAAGAGPWRVYRRVVTNAAGVAVVATRLTGSTQFAVRYAGAVGRTGIVAGAVATVRVRARISADVRVGARPGLVAARGAGTTLSGGVSPTKRSQVVYLQRLVGRSWRNVGSVRLNAKSAYSFRLPTHVRGASSYRVHIPADSRTLAGYSAIRVVQVR